MKTKEVWDREMFRSGASVNGVIWKICEEAGHELMLKGGESIGHGRIRKKSCRSWNSTCKSPGAASAWCIGGAEKLCVAMSGRRLPKEEVWEWARPMVRSLGLVLSTTRNHGRVLIRRVA